MTNHAASLALNSPEQTEDLARLFAGALLPGDCLLLEGQIGAGKTFFARTLIQSLLPLPEDVPSPTFTLVQIYDGPDSEIWHSDLYRLSSLEEVEELGLFEAFDHAITLVEWPEKLAELTPGHALRMRFSLSDSDENARALSLHWQDPKWDRLIAQATS
ncbi:tRNA threonylcarbamoyladenosine biosynthesis protein TsaE [Epibacterium ulvae]|uniref:tRNA threonylcarbamoyladenosine biosynthesis protein TsaE n=1 Tax=Epibacterium ulvae TaxID=1156985 RepID=A0A1G5RGI7_9RHOB|nr:tRNA (adenosine(37)-N6)-threonylcarbamoyltransferase complex ATPase subunit type 1 TsaE [Epibacterium ulvae]SCZ72481.1 tRNA threonylcarbamoyladenosine biosynthesis protein TsaE [Epibacterium ulvae]